MDSQELQFQDIYDSFQPKILRYMARLVNDNEAEDLTQEVFVKVGQALAAFRGESSLSTWIYRIATNTALDRRRSPSFRWGANNLSDPVNQEDETEIDDLQAADKDLSTEQQFVRQEMNECIAGFIERLPESYQTVLVLSEIEGLKNHEIAEILGVTLGTVKIRLHRARLKLREELVARCDVCWVEENEFLPNLNHVLKEVQKAS